MSNVRSGNHYKVNDQITTDSMVSTGSHVSQSQAPTHEIKSFKKKKVSLFFIHKTESFFFFSILQDKPKYLAYENFPVLCRDAAATMLPIEGKLKKKYVCKQTFNCCRQCNHMFYACLKQSNQTYGYCMRVAYKCMCDCIETRSYKELPYKPIPSHLTK